VIEARWPLVPPRAAGGDDLEFRHEGEWVMEWYWWVLIAVGVIALIKLAAGRRKPQPSGANEIAAMFQRSRDEAALADQELAKVVTAIADLFVVAPNSAYSNIVSRAGLQSCVSDFMRQAGLTGMHTSTKMLHVVMSPVQITALVKMKPTEPRTAVREFIRTADDKWAFRTRDADDMERAVREADQESDRVVALMKRAAATQAASAAAGAAPPQSPSPAQRQAAPRPSDPAARIAADLSAAALSRQRMNLLWVGPLQLELLETMAKGVHQNVVVETLAADEPTPAADLFKAIAQQISAGQVTAQDIAWAIRVDAIADEAEAAFKRGDVLEAIERYRDALQDAPGCDVYLMSMGTCYAELGALRDAVCYYERAAQISPRNAQIARNLAGARAALNPGPS
jgi:Flp pilus assembly protein TadD